MTRDEIVVRLKQITYCLTHDDCDQCPYLDKDCVPMDSVKQNRIRAASEIRNAVKLLKKDAAELATSALAEPDPVNHPAHYTYGKHECIEEMEIMFGREAVISYCRLAAYKYKYRAGHKDDAQLDYQKADWYLDKAAELMARNKQEVTDAHKQQG